MIANLSDYWYDELAYRQLSKLPWLEISTSLHELSPKRRDKMKIGLSVVPMKLVERNHENFRRRFELRTAQG